MFTRHIHRIYPSYINTHIRSYQTLHTGWRKRKVVLVIGYMGTHYKGLQYTPLPNIPTIENELQIALYKIGCISESNFKHLGKIGWSRSSRTDKGVHAARLVISAKLLVPQVTDNFDDLLKKLNESLPNDIRVFSCIRVNKGFSARKACHWREYEYLLPTKLVLNEWSLMSSLSDDERWLPHAQSEEEFVDRMNEALRLMEGSKSMHNFHRRKLRKKYHEPGRSTPSNDCQVLHTDDDTQSDVDDSGQSDIDNESDTEDDDSTELIPSQENIKFYSDWIPEFNHSLKPHRDSKSIPLSYRPQAGSIYIAEASVLPVRERSPFAEEPMISIRLRGQNFLLHQIRLMVSAAVLYARGIIPLSCIEVAIESPFKMHFPLAPSQGLLLVTAGFSRNANKQDYALRASEAESDDIVMLSHDENRVCEEYQLEHIYARVLSDWKSDDMFQARKWFLHSDDYVVSRSMEKTWRDILSDVRNTRKKDMEMEISRRIHRTQLALEKYESVKSSEEVIKSGRKVLGHRDFLPNGIATELIKRHRLLPSGTEVIAILRSLACKIASGEIPLEYDAVQLADYVDNTGGYQHWVHNEPKLEWIV